jgi:hypothetical protein
MIKELGEIRQKLKKQLRTIIPYASLKTLLQKVNRIKL